MLAQSISFLGISSFMVLAVHGAEVSGQPARPVTFSKDIAPVLQKSCQSCHHPGTSAPMSLMTYEETRPWARSIKQRVALREMPPWHLDKTVGIRQYKGSYPKSVIIDVRII